MLGIYARTSKDNALEVTSTIEQQIKAGVLFAKQNKLEYQIYSDKGISGYKISDEEDKDPFNNRPEFTKLINDIKNNKINCVWVWEHSRLSRNQYASAYIFNIFQNYKITLYEKDKEFNLSDPTNQMLRQILDAVAQYERQLIVGRTTRGLYNAIDSGKRAHAKFFGYKRVGRDKNKNLIWEPVESELTQISNWYAQYKEGKSLRSIILNQTIGTSEPETQVLLQRATKLGRFLAHAEYTGYNLNMKGLEILHKFEKCEIPNLQELKQRKYWVKSLAYTREIISIDEWVDIREKLQKNKITRNENQAKKRKAEKSLSTGLIKCGCCGLYYYYYHMYYKKRNSDNYSNYYYYYHHKTFGNQFCDNKPKSLDIEKIDSIFEMFVIYYFMLFDTNKTAMQDTVNHKNLEIMKLKESLKNIKSEIDRTKRQIEKFKLALDNTDDVKAITILATRISDEEEKIKELTEKYTNNNSLLEDMNGEIEKLQSDITFYSMADQILNFHKKYNLEEKRTTLLRLVDEAVIFGTNLLIKNANNLFIFDVRKNYKLPEYSYNVFEVMKGNENTPNDINISLAVPQKLSQKVAQNFFSENKIKYEFKGQVYLIK